MNRDSYLEGIELTFKSAAMVDFFCDEQHCDNHPTWSSAFSLRLRESLRSSTILNFLANEQDAKENYAVLYSALEEHLTTDNVAMARVLANWQSIFKLKCE